MVLPPHQRQGVHIRRAVRGWGVNILEDARHWIGLLQYNPSTGLCRLAGPMYFVICRLCPFFTSQCWAHRVHRVAKATFWRTFHQEGKISPGWCGCMGVHAHSFAISTITYKVVVYDSAERADTLLPVISLL